MLLETERQLLMEMLMQVKMMVVKRLVLDPQLLILVLVHATATLQVERLPLRVCGALTMLSNVKEMLSSTLLHTDKITSEMSQSCQCQDIIK